MRLLYRGAVATSAGSAEYTVPTGFATEVRDIELANTNATDVTVTLYLVPSGGTADTTNQLIPGITLKANTIFQWEGNQKMNTGDTIQIVASASGVAAHITGDVYRD